VLEEVLRPEVLRKRKDRAALAVELAAGPGDDRALGWLWLYVKAEQVRYAIGELLGYLDIEEVEQSLSRLADAVLTHLLHRLDPAGRFLVIALGKYGGAELTFGSDLDLMLVARAPDALNAEPLVFELRRLVGFNRAQGSLFEIDLRLRPHGEAGPLVTTLESLDRYHRDGSAQAWERQLLTRARIVTGPPDLTTDFLGWMDRLLYREPLSPADAGALWAMRGRIANERDAVVPRERAFKTAAGGLVDFEFLVQLLQLRHGQAESSLRQPSTRQGLRALAHARLLSAATVGKLLENYDFLKRIEILLRRDANKPVSLLGATAEERLPLARWLGFVDEAAFWAEHCRRMAETRTLVLAALPEGAQTRIGS
jgi:glutamate-ammonia-ligase adenylyltransferase